MTLCFGNISAETGLYSSLFLAGLAGGFTHCAGMCGPFVLAQAREAPPDQPLIRRLAGNALLPYHMGRATTYIMMAVLFSTIFNTALLFSPFRSLIASMMLFMASLVFLSNILPALGRVFPYLARMRLPVPQDLIMNLARPVLNGKVLPGKNYVLGLLLGFMPCGMVVAALMTVSTFEDPVKAALGMSLFALGTIPALILTATGGQIVNMRFPQAMPALKLMTLTVSTGILLMTAGKIIFS